VTRVRDIAEVKSTFKDPEGFARVGGESALTLEVSKRTGENIIDTIEQVRAVVAAQAAGWPAGVDVSYSQDRSSDIRQMLSDLQNNVLSAVLLVMIVIVWALGWRSAALVGIAIPGSFLTGILVLSVFGLTMNIVVLFSLILAVGMLVDGAIVVTEFADRKMAEGLHRREAYALAGNDAMQLIATCKVDGADDAEAVIRHLTPFLTAGLQAPQTSASLSAATTGRKAA